MDRDALAKAMFYANENPYMAADAVLEAIADAAPVDPEETIIVDNEPSGSSGTTPAGDGDNSGSTTPSASGDGDGGTTPVVDDNSGGGGG